MYKLVLFDLDGTIIDSSEGLINAAKEALTNLKLEILPDEEIKSCIGLPIGEPLGKIYGWDDAEKKAFYDIFRPIYKNKYLFQCDPFPGMVPLLSELKESGHHIGIATNKRKDSTELLLDHLEITDLFDIVVAQDQKQIRDKSDMILDALEIMHICKEDSVLVGDSVTDLEAAEKAGICFIGVKFGFGFKESEEIEFKLVNTVKELRELLLA